MVVPHTDDEVTNVYMNVRRQKPTFPGFAYGFLYATGSTKRRTVAVPYNFGVTKLESANDFEVSASVVDMGVGRIQVDNLPNTDTALEFSYSIIYVPPSSPGNVRVARNRCPALRTDVDWRGNILVVKHGKRKAIINVEPEDASLVDGIVNACAFFFFSFEHGLTLPRLFQLSRRRAVGLSSTPSQYPSVYASLSVSSARILHSSLCLVVAFLRARRALWMAPVTYHSSLPTLM
ncbi:hypothetical protein DFH06DRAFT_1131885 [Mycena polygramma]|nr:hypothetical protein DFH06DRAFT_1131885 [Mycena polygramma]